MEDRKQLYKAFWDTLNECIVSGRVVSTTPFLRIAQGDSLDVQLLNGRGMFPTPDANEYSVVDFETAAYFFDAISPLWEGPTGFGKTYTSNALARMMVTDEGFYEIRSSGGIFGVSPLKPFTRSKSVDGFPVMEINHEACSQYHIIFMDEISRAKQDQLYMVADGHIRVGNDHEYLRIPIPGTDRFKAVCIQAAMNPPDVLHKDAKPLDIAGENRFVRLPYPNGTAEAAASQRHCSVPLDLHQKFWNELKRKTGLEGNWKTLFPYITDSHYVRSELTTAQVELIDTLWGLFAGDIVSEYERNVSVVKSSGVGVNIQPGLGNDQDIARINERLSDLKHGFVRRDFKKMESLALLLGCLSGVKDKSYDFSVSNQDVLAAIGVSLESKRRADAEPGRLMELVNNGFHGYLSTKLRAKDNSFTARHGTRAGAHQRAVTIGFKESGFGGYLSSLRNNITSLNTHANSAEEALVRSRLVADLCTLIHFAQAYEEEFCAALKEAKPCLAVYKLFERRSSDAAIYEHRLQSILEDHEDKPTV